MRLPRRRNSASPQSPSVGTNPFGVTVDPAAYPTITFDARRPVYVAFGAPGNVTIAINGRQVVLPHVAAGQRVRLNSAGVM